MQEEAAAVSNLDEAISSLIACLGQDKVVMKGPAYERACAIWNAAIQDRPAAVVACETTADVRSCVLVTRDLGVSISVRGGGHDWSGRSLQGEVVIDLSKMNNVAVDGDTAFVGGGALSQGFADAVSASGKSAATGIIGTVGFAGLASGGGYGHYVAHCGLACDNLLAVELVLADGRVVNADATREPDLYWAVQGGGGNFGVITKLTVRLYPIPDIYDGSVAFSWDQAQSVFRSYNELVQQVPDELSLMPTFSAAPDGTLSVVLHHAWCGAPQLDETYFERVKMLGSSSQFSASRKTLAQVLLEAEKRTMKGVSWIVRTVTLKTICPAAVAVITAAMECRSSPLSWVAAHPFYGAGTRIPVESTAFGIRESHFMVGIYTAWTEGDEADHRAWADETEAKLKPLSLNSAYPNYFGSDRPEQALQAYGVNTERLLAIKKHYDPTNRFQAISLPSPVITAR